MTGEPTSDDIAREDASALSAEYVLGLLTPDEGQAFDAVLGVDPDLRDEYAFWADRMAVLADDVPAVVPPARVLTRIRAALFDAAPTPVAATPVQSWLQRLGLLPAMAGGLVAALAVLWVFNIVAPPGGMTTDITGQVPPLTAQIAAADDTLVVQASYDAAAGTLQITRTAGDAVTGRVLELWLIAGDAAPVSLGVLPDTGDAVVRVPADVARVLAGGTLAISDEPVGGSPTGAPTGAVLATGVVAQG
ncbi:Anti-sigma-K factor RskA [Loktanella fryxellensis]|uniref:Anti-sigma-K factor RskA n=1 Tax=Loktanella fryxellensis TaxID=245187 RepID=A0A1H7Z5Y0_9RHOB|nr:anti-sigma factor [Loktanella fryxellensis]SEM52877.1 Anti-sigma-K factor RskA [Loktanella fryxellensis]